MASVFEANLGSYRITALLDGMAPLGRDLFSGDEAAIDAALAAVGAPDLTLPAPVNAYLLRSEDRTILVDAETGELQMLGSGLGQTAAALASAGVSPEDVDTVVATQRSLAMTSFRRRPRNRGRASLIAPPAMGC